MLGMFLWCLPITLYLRKYMFQFTVSTLNFSREFLRSQLDDHCNSDGYPDIHLCWHTLSQCSSTTSDHIVLKLKIRNRYIYILDNNPFYIGIYHWIGQIMILDWQPIEPWNHILKDICFEQDDYLVWCDTKEQNRNKFVKYRKVRVIIDLIRCKA